MVYEMSTEKQVQKQECVEPAKIKSKSIAFVSIMSALGVVFAAMTPLLTIMPGVNVDLSHIGTYIVSLAGGPIFGAFSGAIGGIIPAATFGNALVIPGKIMTGVTVGFIAFGLRRLFAFIFKRFNMSMESKGYKALQIIIIPIAGIAGYIPEFVYTVWDLTVLAHLPNFVIATIMTKAWIEIICITALMTGLFAVPPIAQGIKGLIGDNARLKTRDYTATGIVIIAAIVMMMSLLMGFGYATNTAEELAGVFFGWLIGAGIALGALVLVLLVKMRNAPCPPSQ